MRFSILIRLVDQWLIPSDAIKILQLSKLLKNYEAKGSEIALPIPWESYLRSSVYQAVRDYLILKSVKRKYENADAVDKTFLSDLVLGMRATRLTLDPKFSDYLSERRYLIWDNILTSVTTYNKTIEAKSIQRIRERLTQHGYQQDRLDVKYAKLIKLFQERAHIVLTFNSNRVCLQSEKILNTFEFKRERLLDSSLHNRPFRISVELLHYLNADTHVLHEFILNCAAHPCYGTLQLYIRPITHYGESFVIIDPSIRKSITAVFGAPLEQDLGLLSLRAKPVRLSDSLSPLIAQLSDEWFKICLEVCEDKPFPADFDIQYRGAVTQYIELQILTHIPLHDPALINHIHLATADPFSKIDELIAKGINVSAGVNPYQYIDMTKPNLYDTTQKFLITETLKYIYKAALIIAETKSSHLEFSADEKLLQFTFKITYNQPALHQVQAATLLQLLGVNSYFKDMKLFSFKEKDLCYRLPLTGKRSEIGGLTDHDDYLYTYASLKKLLEKFLTKIFGILLISKQNEEYYLSHNKPHPITGKGATKEKNQTKPIILGEAKPYPLTVHWIYDRISIEVPEIYLNWVLGCISTVLTKSYIKKINNSICINASADEILSELEKSYFAYQACVIYDDSLENYGKLFLALRKGTGFTTPGGHNNNPFSWIGAFLDVEFGELKPNWCNIDSQKIFLGQTWEPATTYYALPSSCLETIQVDEYEFGKNKPYQFDIWRLGNLTEQEISCVVEVLGITLLEYTENFNRALPLRPVPSIMIYLQWAEKTLTNSMQDLFYGSSQFTVKIDSSFQSIYFQGKEYWKPGADFGQIQIFGQLRPLELLMQAFEKLNSLTVILLEQSIIVTGINPHALILFIENRCAQLINFNLTEIQEFLRSPEHKFSFLKKYNLVRICEGLMSIYSEPLQIIEYLGYFSEKFLLSVIKEKITVSTNEEKGKAVESLIALETLFKLLLKQPWGALKKTSLHIAVEHNEFLTVQYLSEKENISAKTRDLNRDTPLHYGCWAGHLKIVKYFIETRKESLLLKNNKKQSLWFTAALNNHWDIVEFLVESLSKEFLSSSFKLKKLARCLINEAKNEENGQSILHMLLRYFPYSIETYSIFYRIFNLLLPLCGCCVSLGDKNAQTPLHLAAQYRLTQIIKPLLERKADINCQDIKKETPLSKAINNADMNMLSVLLECNTFISQQDMLDTPGFDLISQVELNFPLLSLGENSIQLASAPTPLNKPTEKKKFKIPPFNLISMLTNMPLDQMSINILYLVMIDNKITACWKQDEKNVQIEFKDCHQKEVLKYFVAETHIKEDQSEFKEIVSLSKMSWFYHSKNKQEKFSKALNLLPSSSK